MADFDHVEYHYDLIVIPLYIAIICEDCFDKKHL